MGINRENGNTGFYLMLVETGNNRSEVGNTAIMPVDSTSFTKFIETCYNMFSAKDVIPDGVLYEYLCADEKSVPQGVEIGMDGENLPERTREQLSNPHNGVDLKAACCCLDMGVAPSVTDHDQNIVLYSREYDRWHHANTNGNREQFINEYRKPGIEGIQDQIRRVNDVMNDKDVQKVARDVGITMLAKTDPRAAVILTGVAAVQDIMDAKQPPAKANVSQIRGAGTDRKPIVRHVTRQNPGTGKKKSRGL